MSVIVSATNPTGYLTVGGVTLLGPAFGIFEDLTVLLAPSEWRGANVVVPNRTGRVPLPVTIDEATYKFKLNIAGDRNPSGVRYDDPTLGYLSNLAILRGVLDQPSKVSRPDGTRPVTYVIPGYGSFDRDCHLFLDVTAGLNIGHGAGGLPGSMKRATLTVRVHDGLFGT